MEKKSKLTETQLTVSNFITKKPGSTQALIVEKTQLKPIVVGNAIKALVKAKLIKETKNKEEGNSYDPVEVKEKAIPKEKEVKTKEEKTEVKAEASKPKAKELVKRERSRIMPRDLTRYEIEGDGIKLGKGRFVLALVQKYMMINPKTTFEGLEKVFSKELQKAYGVFAKLADVKKKQLEARYFTEASEVIKTADDVKVCVSREWGKGNTPQVFEYARKAFPFKLKEHKES